MGEQLGGSSIDVGIDVGKARLAMAWPYWGITDYIDLGKAKLSRHEELWHLREWLITKVPDGVQLWIDRPLFHGTGTAAGERLTETIGAIMTAQQWQRPPIIVHSSTWKAQVVGNHRAAKDEMRDWLGEHYPDHLAICQTEDEVDATIIALYGKGRADGVIAAPDVKRPSRRH